MEAADRPARPARRARGVLTRHHSRRWRRRSVPAPCWDMPSRSPTSEPAAVHYTVDGSTPTLASPTWSGEGPQRADEAPIAFAASGTLQVDRSRRESAYCRPCSPRATPSTRPPRVTTAQVNGTAAGGYYPATTITLTQTDEAGGGGVAATEHRLDGGPFVPYTAPVPVTKKSAHVLEFRSRDVAGNEEAIRGVAGGIDATAPTIDVASAGEQRRPAGGAVRPGEPGVHRRGLRPRELRRDGAVGQRARTRARAGPSRSRLGPRRRRQRAHGAAHVPRGQRLDPAAGTHPDAGRWCTLRAPLAGCSPTTRAATRVSAWPPAWARSADRHARRARARSRSRRPDLAGNRATVARSYVVVGTLPSVSLTPRRVPTAS